MGGREHHPERARRAGPGGVSVVKPAPSPDRGSAVSLHLTVDDCDQLASRVMASGVSMDRGPEDAGDVGRVAVLRDPFGHRWFVNQPE